MSGRQVRQTVTTWALVNNPSERCLAPSSWVSVLLFIYCSLQCVFPPRGFGFAPPVEPTLSVKVVFKRLGGHYCHSGFPLSSSPSVCLAQGSFRGPRH